MESNKIKNSIGVVRNPIGVIGLFLVLIEAIAALVIVNSSLSDLLNLILVLFIVVFPFVVLLVFYLLVTKHTKNCIRLLTIKMRGILLVHIIALLKQWRLLKLLHKRMRKMYPLKKA